MKFKKKKLNQLTFLNDYRNDDNDNNNNNKIRRIK